MPHSLILTKASRAVVEPVAPQEGLRAARAAWESGAWTQVRLLTDTGAPVWIRGASSSPETAARDRAAIAAAAGLTHLALDCPQIGGLADLDAPLSLSANTFEVRTGTSGLDGLLSCDGALPRLRDLLIFLDIRLDSARRLTEWQCRPGRWPNPAHWAIDVSLERVQADSATAGPGPNADHAALTA